MGINRRLPDYFLGKLEMIGTVVFAALFAIAFLFVCIPFSDTAWFQVGDSVLFLFTAGFFSLSLMVIILSRVLMYYSKRWFSLTFLTYILWCFAEVVIICIFYTFVTVDLLGDHTNGILKVFGKALMYGFLALIVPETIAGLYIALVDRNRTIHKMTAPDSVPAPSELGPAPSETTPAPSESAPSPAVSGPAPSESSPSVSGPAPSETAEGKVSLCDDNGVLKLSLNSSDLYYLEAEDNYVRVWYSDKKGELKHYMIRCRLKTMEESFRGSSLIRCHRKYIINADKVKVFRKEPEGYCIDLDNEAIPPIQVTKTYLPNIMERFSEK